MAESTQSEVQVQDLTRKISADEVKTQYASGTRDFRNKIIEGDLSGVDLTDADFYNCNLTRCAFQQANLTRCDLAYADMTGCDLRGACLVQARIAGAKMAYASLIKARLLFCDGAPVEKLPEKREKPKPLTEEQIALLNKTEMTGIKEAGGEVPYDVLIKPHYKPDKKDVKKPTPADLEKRDKILKKWKEELKLRNGWGDKRADNVVDLYHVVGNDTFYTGSSLGRALIQDGHLRNSRLNKTELFGASLRNAMMRGVHVHDAQLKEAMAEKCNLVNSELKGADCEKADLQGADITGAKLGDDKEAANFKNASFAPHHLPPKREPVKPKSAAQVCKRWTISILFEVIKEMIFTAAEELQEDAMEVLQDMAGDVLEEVEDAVEEGLEEVEEAIKENLGGGLEMMAKKAAESMDAIVEACKEILKAIKYARKNPGEWVEKIDPHQMSLMVKAFKHEEEERLAILIGHALEEMFQLVLAEAKDISDKAKDKMDLRLESEGEDGGKKTQSWTLVSEKGAKDVNKGAVTLFFEQLTSKLIKRLAEGVARSLIFQGSYGAEPEAKKRWASLKERTRALTAKSNAAVAPHPDSAGPASPGKVQKGGSFKLRATLAQAKTTSVSFKKAEAKKDPSKAVKTALKTALEPILKQMLGGDEEGDDPLNPSDKQIGRLAKEVTLHLAQSQLEKFKLAEKVNAIGKVARHYEDALKRKLMGTNEKLMKYIKSGGDERSLGERLERSTRAKRARMCISAGSDYARRVGGFLGLMSYYDLARFSFNTPPKVLVREINEIEYMQERLKTIEELTFTPSVCLDSAEAWTSFLLLRARLSGRATQEMLDAIIADADVLTSLGMADAMREANFKTAPEELVKQLKKGPGQHIRKNAYIYRRKLNAERARVARIQQLQMRVLGFVHTLILSAFISIGGIIAQWIYDSAQG